MSYADEPQQFLPVAQSTRVPDQKHMSLVRSSIWMIGMRWSVRSLGVLSTIILARLLEPQDFGIVAMAMVVVGFFEVLFTYTGVDLAVIRLSNPIREHYDSAWTLNVVQGVAVALVLLLAAPLAVEWFGDPRVGPVIQILAVAAAITGCENIGVLDFRRDLRFDLEFRYGVYKKAVSFLVTLAFAFWLQTYWALVIGTVAGRCAEVALSYLLHPYRPRFSFARLAEIWSFSQWLLVARIGRYITSKTDEFMVGGYSGTTTMGSYYVASDVAMSPTQEVVQPMARGLYPIYSRMTHDSAALDQSFEKVLGFTVLLSVSVGCGISAVAEDLVAVLLGPQWESAATLMRWLALAAAVAGVLSAFDTWMTVRGHVRNVALYTWIHFGALAPALLLAAPHGSLQIAATRAVIVLLTGPVLIWLGIRNTSISVRHVMGVLWPAVLAGGIMWTLVSTFGLEAYGPFVSLLADAALGAVTFAGTIGLLWWLRGCPTGVERTLLTYCRHRLSS
jgi:lipopolysaccharide exporter